MGYLFCKGQDAQARTGAVEGFVDNTRYAGLTHRGVSLQEGSRMRRVRVVRDYGMFDRREAPNTMRMQTAAGRSMRNNGASAAKYSLPWTAAMFLVRSRPSL
jgi:hypothetical protein